MRRSIRQPSSIPLAWREASAPVPALPPALPVLLVLEPTMTGRPWSAAVARAASTLQVRGVGERTTDAGVASTIAYALDVQGVERIVVGGEGPGAPPSSFGARAAELSRLVDALARRPVPLDAVWLDTSSGRVSAVGTEEPVAPLVDALLAPRAAEPCDA